MKHRLANYITCIRIIGTVGLLWLEPQSPVFFMVYTLTGLTDVLDGYIARKTNTTSALGAKLDSIADLLFYAVMLGKLLPILWVRLPVGIWYAIGAILCVRLLGYVVAAVKYRQFASLHTYLNKLAGLAVFAVPYILLLPVAVPLCWGVCAIAGMAAIEELLIHMRNSTYRANIVGIGSKEEK